MNIKTLLDEKNISKILSISIFEDSLIISMLSSNDNRVQLEYSRDQKVINNILPNDWELGQHRFDWDPYIGFNCQYIFKVKYLQIVELLTYTFPYLKSIILQINIDDVIYNFIIKYKNIQVKLFVKIDTFEDFLNIIKYNLNFCELVVEFGINEITYQNYKYFCTEIVKNCDPLITYFGQLYILNDTIIEVNDITIYEATYADEDDFDSHEKSKALFKHRFENKKFKDQIGKTFNVVFPYLESTLKVLPTFGNDDYNSRISV